MNAYEVPFVLLALFAFAAIIPVWMWALSSPYAGSLGLPSTFLAGMVLPVMAMLFIASWFN